MTTTPTAQPDTALGSGPDTPYRMELSLELPGTPEQVWAAIATGRGLTAWMLPSDVEEREGGAVAFHMGPEMSSRGTVTGWEPPRRLAYEEPEWAALAGRPDAPVTPMVSEFVVEARSGGTCLLRVVTSAFGIGADWEREFFDDMVANWQPMFEHLRLYLTHFPGQTATTLEVGADVPGEPDAVWAALLADVGAERVGQDVAVRGLPAVVHHLEPHRLLLRLTGDVPGLLVVMRWGADTNGEEGATHLHLGGYLFGDEAPSYVERERDAWEQWLSSLQVAR